MAVKRIPNYYPEQKKDGTTAHRVMLSFPDPVTGRRKQKMVTYPTKAAALDALAVNRAERARGHTIVPTKRTVADLLDKWLEGHSANLRSTSIDTYRTTIRLHIVPYIGSVAVQDVTPEFLEGYYGRLHAAGVGDVCRHAVHRRLVQAFDDAARWHWIRENPAKLARSPRYQAHVRQVWSEAELGRFLAVAKESLFGPFFWLDALTGMRRGEMLGLQWDDINWDAQTVHVRHNMVYLRNHWENHPTKNNKERLIDVPVEFLDVLRAHRVRQAELRLKMGAQWPDTNLVLTTHLGTPICPQNLYPEFRKLCAAAGVPHIRLHDMRHTHATWLLANGWTLADVAARLGHDITTLMTTYAHAIPARQRVMVQAMALQLGLSAPHQDGAPDRGRGA